MSHLKCSDTPYDEPLDAAYWEAQYKDKTTGWDLGEVSPPIRAYADTITDKNSHILIPGCGNSYEAEYLLERGFTNITVIDIAPTPVTVLKEKFKNNPNIQIVLGDFFEHHGQYGLIIEQTFFCALPPIMRQKYVWKMHQLLAEEGILAGLLFNRTFESGPPFGGSKKEYEKLFAAAFDFIKMEISKKSIAPRANSELFIELKKNRQVVNLYDLEDITCKDAMETVTEKLLAIDGILNVSVSSDFTKVLIVSTNEIETKTLRDVIAHAGKYTIQKIKN
jgi:SAM-dependent methyltransferase